MAERETATNDDAPVRRGRPLGAWTRRAVAVVLGLLLGGCVGPPSKPPRIPDPPATSTPAEAFRRFSEALGKDDLAVFYSLLSRDTQYRYELWEFETMFRKTRFGKLLRHLMLEWKVQGYEVQEERVTAKVTLVHPVAPGFSKSFDMVLEGTDWRVRLSIAQALDMPEFDERFLYPEMFMVPEDGLPEPSLGTERKGEISAGQDRAPTQGVREGAPGQDPRESSRNEERRGDRRRPDRR